MKLVFGTNNKRKVEDLQNIINEMNFKHRSSQYRRYRMEYREIDENDSSIEEN